MHYFTQAEIQWVLQRREEAPAEPWAILIKRFHQVFLFGDPPTSNSLQVLISNIGEGKRCRPYTDDENQWLKAYRPQIIDPQSIADFHVEYCKAFPKVTRSKEAIVKQSAKLGVGWQPKRSNTSWTKTNVTKITANKEPRKWWHRHWTTEELAWISDSQYDTSRAAHQEFLEKFADCPFGLFKGRVRAEKQKKDGKTKPRALSTRWTEDEEIWLRNSSRLDHREAFNAFKQFSDRNIGIKAFRNRRRSVISEAGYNLTSPPQTSAITPFDKFKPFGCPGCKKRYKSENGIKYHKLVSQIERVEAIS